MLVKGLKYVPNLIKQGNSSLPCVTTGSKGVAAGLHGIISSIGHPIHVATGFKTLSGESELDFELPGPIPLTWQRFYNSHDTRTNSLLSQGWSTPYSIELELTTDADGASIVVFVDNQGRSITFPEVKPGEGIYSESENCWLWRTKDGRYLVQTIDNLYLLFSTPIEGLPRQRLQLQRIEDNNANFIELRWKEDHLLHQITDSTGRLLEFHYDSASHINQISLATPAPGETPGILVSYQYDKTQQLAGVINRTGHLVRRFAYNTDRLMTMHANAAGLECYYEWQGNNKWARVVRHWTNDGDHYDIKYTLLTKAEVLQPKNPWDSPLPNPEPAHPVGQTQVIDQLGRVQVWTWNGDYCILTYTNPLKKTWRASYDEFKHRLSFTNPKGFTTKYRYDVMGFLASQTDPLGRTWSVGWTLLGLPWRQTAPNGAVTTFEYDDRGNLTKQINPNGSVICFAYDDRGLLISITDAKGGVKHLSWNIRAQLTKFTDCSNRTTRYVYDGWNNLAQVIDALGQTTQFVCDANGRLYTKNLPDGSYKNYQWNVAGQLLSVTDNLDRTERFVYNRRGQLTTYIDAEKRQVILNYDKAHRVESIVNQNGRQFKFKHDAANQLIEQERVGGVRVAIEYDSTAQPITITYWPGIGDDFLNADGSMSIRSDSNSAKAPKILSQRIQLFRDKVGRLIGKRTAEHSYVYRYDVLDQLLEAKKLKIRKNDGGLQALSTLTFAYDEASNFVFEQVRNDITGEQYALKHSYDQLDNRTQTV
jgi:YD repeat-containing protein